jgi:hypothetical protein
MPFTPPRYKRVQAISFFSFCRIRRSNRQFPPQWIQGLSLPATADRY